MNEYSYEDLPVDTGIPLPSKGSRRGSGLAHLLRKMTYGDSVFIPYREGAKPSSLSSNCHTASRAAGVRLTIKKWSQCSACSKPRSEFVHQIGLNLEPCRCHPVRRVMPDVIDGVRVWRIDQQAEASGKQPKNPARSATLGSGRRNVKGPRL
jgi:hypothetical protein